MKPSSPALLTVLSAALVLTGLSAQSTDRSSSGGQAAPTFKSEIGVVEIDAVVNDASGNFVRDLTKDDF
jgi:hypothetical protein